MDLAKFGKNQIDCIKIGKQFRNKFLHSETYLSVDHGSYHLPICELMVKLKKEKLLSRKQCFNWNTVRQIPPWFDLEKNKRIQNKKKQIWNFDQGLRVEHLKASTNDNSKISHPEKRKTIGWHVKFLAYWKKDNRLRQDMWQNIWWKKKH